jgi:hypothetical protein
MLSISEDLLKARAGNLRPRSYFGRDFSEKFPSLSTFPPLFLAGLIQDAFEK